jgi:predicted DNA-binding transcriptional regulator AlpA
MGHKAPIQIPPALDSLALIDAKTAAAVGGMSASWWFGQVAAGAAPQPAIRAPKRSRWLLDDVRRFWVCMIERAKVDADTRTVTNAKRAVAAKQAKRHAEALEVAQ